MAALTSIRKPVLQQLSMLQPPLLTFLQIGFPQANNLKWPKIVAQRFPFAETLAFSRIEAILCLIGQSH